MKRILTHQGITEINTPRQCFREAARSGLISDPKMWFYFIDMRSLTVHTYNEQNVKTVISSFSKFSTALNELVINLKEIK